MFNRHADLLGTEATKARRVGPTLRRLWDYFRSYWLALLLVVVLVVTGTYMQVLIPDLIGQAVDCYLGPVAASSFAGESAGESMSPEMLEAFQQGGAAGEEGGIGSNCWYTEVEPQATMTAILRGLTGLILLIAGLYVGNAIVSGIQFYFMGWAGQHVLRDLRADIFRHIHRLTMSYFSRHEAGDVMSRITNDTDTLNQIFSFGLVQVAQGSLLIVWIVLRMLSKNAPFAALSLATLPLMFLATQWFSRKARQAFRQARQEIGEVNADLQESISAVREVQAFSREEENIAQFRASNAANRDANIRAQAFSSALAPTLEALSYVSLALVAGVGGIIILGDGLLLGYSISLGLIVTFIGYTQQFNRPVQQIAVLWTNIQSAVAGGERIFDLIDTEPDIQERRDAVSMPRIKGRVRFENVRAAYKRDEPVLRGIDLEARPGETVAIVGPTGAGKTTIINLIPRFYDVTGGRVTIDGHDVRDVTRRSLRQQLGIVLQDTFLFSDSVLNNIRYGRPEATDEEVIAAAELAHADGFIERLPDGYQTVLGERGGGLSQGQRQLLSIARVAVADPRILILDEATSSVDTRTERKIQEALDELLAGRTSFVIAHRLSTIRNADQVLVLNEGQIIERGTHDELLAQQGFYYDLYMSQFRRELDEEGLEGGTVVKGRVP
ncbi:MAG: ABC transporter ATP-binding protein [Candidatus Promineifilaceae bacterium]|nr:ABC transporter ATP-binding protein [Candidatus Promineifilaceae bacterium]